MASLATALELTRYPGWQEHYQLTIYQLGWRLGGKCATGRGVHGRIEEHGIHIMQGWYHNTFRLMEEVYEERLRHGLAPRARYPRFADALEPDNGTLMPEYCRQHHRWETYPLNFPPNEEVPGQGGTLSPWQNLHKLMSLGVELAAGLVYDRSRDPVRTAIHEHVAPRERVERILSRLRRALGSTRDDAGSFRSLARMLSAVSRALAVLAERQDECAVVRKLLTRVNLFRAMLDGLLCDVYVPWTGAFNFEAINHLDYRAWLALHGASREALDTSIVRFSYTGMFANLADGAGGGGLVSAGSALRVVLLAAGYKRAFVSKFRAGTGDTLVMPIYDVLAHRGVRFEFFQDVRAVHASDTGEIERITVDRRVTLKGEAYDPAVVVRGVRAWPAQPRYEQIDNEQATRYGATRSISSPLGRGEAGRDAHAREGKALRPSDPRHSHRAPQVDLRRNPRAGRAMAGDGGPHSHGADPLCAAGRVRRWRSWGWSRRRGVCGQGPSRRRSCTRARWSPGSR